MSASSSPLSGPPASRSRNSKSVADCSKWAHLRCILLVLAIQCGIASIFAMAPQVSWSQEANTQTTTATDSVRKPQRIISLAPSITELLLSLGIPTALSADSDSTQQLVAISQFCDYPEEINKLPRVGSLTNPQFETILQLQPDLLLGVSDGASIRQRAEALGIKARFTPQRSLKELLHSITEVADIVDRQAEGAALVDRIRTALRGAKLPEAQGKKALLLFWESLREASVYAAGSNSLDEDLLLAIGLENALETKQSYVQLSLEGILSLKPDVIIILAPGVDREMAEQRVAEFSTLLQSLTAIRENNVLLLNEERYLRPGPRTIETLADLRSGLATLLER